MSSLRKNTGGFQTSGGAHPSRDSAKPSISLHNVAASFQERTVQLTRESSLLRQTQRNLENLKHTERQQNRQVAMYRRDFVQARQERDAAEGEALALQEKSTVLREEIQSVYKQIEDFKSGAQNENERQQSKNDEAILIPHRARRQIYLDYLQGRISAVEQSEQDRQVKRMKLTQAIAHLREKCGEVEERKQVVEQQIRKKNEAMLGETAEGQEIATQVRAALEERKQLREDLRRAKNQP